MRPFTAARALTAARAFTAARALTAAQAVAAAVVVARLARGRNRLPPLRPVLHPPATTTTATADITATDAAGPARNEQAAPDTAARATPAAPAIDISVVIPARDEAARIGPCLMAVSNDPAVAEVIVVDDGSRDGTGELAASMGATVVTGAPLPEGWVGKQWALRQGVAAARGRVVVTLDADARPEPGLVGALVRALDDYDLVSAAPRFACDGALEQALHAAMLATLVYRFGPVGPAKPPPPHRVIANGQCLAFRREAMAAADGFGAVREKMTDDVALARHLAGRGWRVGFLDAGALLEVDMHDSAAELWREWGRSLPLHDVTDPVRQAADLAVVWLTAGLPVLRLAFGRPAVLDVALLAGRLLLTGALRGSYSRPGLGLLLSPLLDPAAAARLTQATLRPVRTWRGRTYPPDRVGAQGTVGSPDPVSSPGSGGRPGSVNAAYPRTRPDPVEPTGPGNPGGPGGVSGGGSSGRPGRSGAR
ncbi:dolichol-phosphate mannosyltransferase [Nonomuraea thailandensis]|uniref:Dolichol-phosphate mannosyltransferase n=1 Tax=Nonomuraea thailandensis TaxID=1188745 RepID=A0A9X2K2M9_9ACTN|nr:glycosyltransferase family 2 protein [Nonomuraea thailandensis]MCP2358178.1 dolichol-phosphate mannosyltransferase [Nonomuraea thailandensis]